MAFEDGMLLEEIRIRDPFILCDNGKYYLYGTTRMPEDGFFTSEEEFFSKGKIADALVIATLDDIHYRQTMRALDLGYDILLEKPIAMTLRECEDIRDKAKACGCKFYLGSDSHKASALQDAKENFERIITLLDLKEKDKFYIK